MSEDVKQEEKIVFNPQANYTWRGADMFLLDGATLQFLYNNLAKELEDPESQKIIVRYQMFQAVQAILAKSVERGEIKEAKNEGGE